ncbi:MAG: DUF3015 domain-containing protein [Deferribacteraceae bacterium]|jgi:hypothetical protein|nr:DUF3015 domain-containing protein [Deferribacteraceae bacterium]
MKKILVILGFLLLCGAASASQMNTGCGLGTMLLGNRENSKLMQVLITSTNQFTSTNQSTGITLDIKAFKCTPTKNWVGNEKVGEFVHGNMDNLIRDIAAGSGETITTLASLMDIEDVNFFGKKLQKNFALIFPSADVEYAYVADAIYIISNN